MEKMKETERKREKERERERRRERKGEEERIRIVNVRLGTLMEKAVEFNRERPLMEKAKRSIVLSFSPGVNDKTILL